MRPLQAHCHLGLGKLYRRVGRREEARAELSAAIGMLREMGMTLWLPEAEGELAKTDAGESADCAQSVAGPEPAAPARGRRLVHRGQHVQDRLLDDPIHHRRDATSTLPRLTSRLRDS